jgi:hypothetical protein
MVRLQLKAWRVDIVARARTSPRQFTAFETGGLRPLYDGVVVGVRGGLTYY